MQDMKISGSGTIAPGTYGKVSISGSGQASGPIDCEDFNISGSGRVTGPLHCRNFKTSGSFRSEGEIFCRENSRFQPRVQPPEGTGCSKRETAIFLALTDSR